MNDRTAVLFLILCIAVLLGLIELEKIWEQEKINQKEQKIADLKKQKEDKKKASELEDRIYKVRIRHDGRPETNTATVILDAGDSYDVVINVESSHCYGSVEKFLSEVCRVLKPGGFLLFCDFRTIEGIDELYDQMSKSDLQFINRTDITDNIIQGLDKLSDYREKHIRKSVPLWIRSLFKSYAGIKGTEIYNAFVEGKMQYISAILKK